MSETKAVCFSCGNSVAGNPLENHLPNGRPCPACRDRLLDQVPAALPTGRRRTPEREFPYGAEFEEELADEPRSASAWYPDGPSDDDPMPA